MSQPASFFFERSSVRSFLPQKLSVEEIQHLYRAALQTPTSSHIQAFSILHVSDSSIRHAFFKLTGEQQWVLDAPHFFVFCADLHKIASFAQFEVDGETVSQDAYLASLIDAGLVGMTFSLAAESMGLGSVMIGSIRNSLEKASALLDLPKGVIPVFGMCVGRYDKRKKPKPRLPQELMIFENQYALPPNASLLLNNYQQQLKNYYAQNQLEHASFTSRPEVTWLQIVAAAVQNTKRKFMGMDLFQRGFPFFRKEETLKNQETPTP
jgi:nitroreductase